MFMLFKQNVKQVNRGYSSLPDETSSPQLVESSGSLLAHFSPFQKSSFRLFQAPM